MNDHLQLSKEVIMKGVLHPLKVEVDPAKAKTKERFSLSSVLVKSE